MPAGPSPLSSELERLALAWSSEMPSGAAERLLSFGELLLRWNDTINLTAAKSLEDVVLRHYPDAFAAASALGPSAQSLGDVGSGGGLPAIPVAILRPDVAVCLFEPTRKKASFLKTARRELHLANVTVVAARVEGTPPPPPAAPFDVVMSRATFAPRQWLELGATLVGSGGKVLVFTAEPADALSTPSLPLTRTIPYRLQHGVGAPRFLTVFAKP